MSYLYSDKLFCVLNSWTFIFSTKMLVKVAPLKKAKTLKSGRSYFVRLLRFALDLSFSEKFLHHNCSSVSFRFASVCCLEETIAILRKLLDNWLHLENFFKNAMEISQRSKFPGDIANILTLVFVF